MLVNMSGGKVEEITEIVEPDLLWTNPNPTSAFTAQTVSLPTGYSAYLVEYKNAYGGSLFGIAYLPFNATVSVAGSNELYDGWPFGFGRLITSCTDGSIAFAIGFRWLARNSVEQNNNYGIPTRIWGVKYTL